MEISIVRRRLKAAIDAARSRALQRRQRIADTERAYAAFLEHVATPVTRQMAQALKADGYAFSVFTPAHGVRLASDRSRDDFIDIVLDTSNATPQVIGRVSRTRGSRTIEEDHPIKADASPEAITEDEVLDFLLRAVEPWLER